MSVDPNAKPQLAPGVRLGENQGQKVLLMPERALRLSGPSLEIVSRCDGRHTVAQLVAELQKLYSKADPHKVESDVLSYLQLLHTQRALDFLPA
jgi:pyrroloquinoline quinone biosynthesis protein D